MYFNLKQVIIYIEVMNMSSKTKNQTNLLFLQMALSCAPTMKRGKKPVLQIAPEHIVYLPQLREHLPRQLGMER